MTDKLLQPPLLENIRNYLLQADENQQIFLYVPYIKVEILKKLVDGIKNVTIITTWKIRDLKFGSSELKLYPFCKEHNYELYIHKTIHLKVYSVELKSAIVATGNISHGGLEGGNQECGVLVNELSSSDRMFLEEIKTNTVKIDDYIFDKISEKYDALSSDLPDKVENIDLVEEPKKDEFFKRSDLPMTRSVDDLIKGYENKKLELNYSEDEETNACIEHDLKTYEIEPNLSKEEFEKKLKHNFLTHPFTKKIDEIIEAGDYSGGAGWGTVRKWIRDHCTDVPLPRLWDLTKNTQTLYHWFEKLGNTDDYSYVVDVPGSRSERISKILKYENEVLQVLESPGYTIEEIKKIYEKLERGWYVHDEPSDLSEKENASKSNWHYKREADEKVAKILSLSEEEIGERTSKGKLYKKIVSVIGKLYGNGFIKMWYYESNRGTWSDGIWRLTDEGKREIQRRGLTKTKSIQNTAQKNDLNTNLVLFSAAGDAAFEHFENTVLNNASTAKFENSKMKEFSNVRMWGANDRSTNQNRSKWSKLKKGDILLFFRDKKYVAKMVLEGTEDNYEIAKMIWGEKIDHKTMNVQSKKGETWQLIMYGLPENVTKIDLDHSDLNKLVGYKETFLPTRTLDFMPVREELRNNLERKYGSIQKALESIRI